MSVPFADVFWEYVKVSSSSLVSSASDIRPATVGKINCDNFIYSDVRMGSLNSCH